MKKTITLLALFSCIILNLNAQNVDEQFFKAPDFNRIENNIKESTSIYYYPKLMEKYLSGKTQMTPEEGRHLYFGYVFQQNYQPADTSEFNSKLVEILSRSSFSNSDYAKILEYSDALLLEDPFNLRALNAKMLVYAQQDNADEYKRTAQQRRVVQDAIISTGDGMSENSAFYVIMIAHEYDILPFLGYTFGGEDKILRGNKVNYLSLGDNRFGVARVYFNITPIIKYVSAQGGGKI